MDNNIKDDKLEILISKIKNSNNNHNKLLNYKKAATRINELKIEYNELCNLLTNNKKKKKSNNKMSINDIMDELKNIDSLIENSNDMREIIDNFVRYKMLLNNLNTETDRIKNEIMKVEENNDKIMIHKLDSDDILG
jgi:hypothetical protein